MFDDSTELKVPTLASSTLQLGRRGIGMFNKDWYTERAFDGEIQWREIMGDNTL